MLQVQGLIGAVLLQYGQPVTYASRALTKTEKEYAQIEKELLAIVFPQLKYLISTLTEES